MGDNIDVGERIKRRREQLGMSQQELAEKAGFATRTAISKIENNANGMTQTKLAAVAKALQTTPAYLMGWEEDEPASEESETDRQFFDMFKSMTPEEKDLFYGIMKSIIEQRK